MLTAVRYMLSKLVSPLWRTNEVDGGDVFAGATGKCNTFCSLEIKVTWSSFELYIPVEWNSKRSNCFGQCLLLTRHRGHSPPARQRGDRTVPWLRHNRRCSLLHQRRGVRWSATEKGGPGWLHSSERQCPKGMESCKSECPFFVYCAVLCYGKKNA